MKKQIYKNASGELNIEFDGEFYRLTQLTHELEEEDVICVTKAEIEDMLLFANKIGD